MPKRKVLLVNQEIYHIYNRSVAAQTIFRNKHEFNLFLGLLEYYRFFAPPVRFSHYIRLSLQERQNILTKLLTQNSLLVEIYAFCLMPNHFHILARQISKNGIMNYVRLIQNSYARYLNVKTKRTGSLFQSPFKAVRVETNYQLIHVARYIHLNPLTSYVLKFFKDLESFEWASYTDYCSDLPRKFINTSFLCLSHKNKEALQEFTKDNLSYQRKLNEIKHLVLE